MTREHEPCDLLRNRPDMGYAGITAFGDNGAIKGSQESRRLCFRSIADALCTRGGGAFPENNPSSL